MNEHMVEQEGFDLRRLGNSLAANFPALILILSILFLTTVPFLLRNYLASPYPGFFLKHDLTISGFPSAEDGLDLSQNDRLFKINDTEISTIDDYHTALAEIEAGDTASFAFAQEDRKIISRVINLKELPGSIRTNYYLMPYVMGIIHLAYAIWMQIGYRKQKHSGLFITYTAGMAVFLALSSAGILFHTLEWVWFLAGGLAGGALIQIALLYPTTASSVHRFSFVAYIGYTPWVFLLLTALIQPDALEATVLWPAMIAFLAISYVILISALTYRQVETLSPVTRNKIRLILWSVLAGILPFLIWLFSPIISEQIREISSIYFLFPIVIIPFPLGLAIANFRLTNIKFIFSRVVLYTTLSFFIGAAYALLVSGMGLIFVSQSAQENMVLNGVLIFIFALAFNPLHQRAQSMVDGMLFRREKFLEEKLDAFKGQITQLSGSQNLVDQLSQTIVEYLSPTQHHVFLYDPIAGNYAAQVNQNRQKTSDLKFDETAALIQNLSVAQEPLFRASEDKAFYLPSEENASLDILLAEYLVPIPGQSRLTGFVSLGSAINSGGYTFAELEFLQDICEISGLALERELVYLDLNHRVEELNVMTRVAREVNLTLDMDEIMTLIYDQTQKVIPFQDMLISLKNSQTRTITRVFVIQNNERRHELEQAQLNRGEGLDQFILFSAESIREQDYTQACRKYNVLSGQARYFAWLGVPLRASDETIGAISITCRNPSTVLTAEHEAILTGIANQAAGAIIKAQLLAETETRASQMEMLNEMSSQLTSTLQIEDLNLQIMENAVKLIDCEAGSLLLVDEERGDLIFEEACGPVADEIIGKRLAEGVGLVGRAIRERAPVMVNDVVEDKDWFSDPDEETGFRTRGLLVVPLISQDVVIGALEVINKRNNMPFDKDDQILLSAFGAQAVIAMDNAKLYTLTDQALALRVEELSVMQRIDRELNTSLDLDRAMNITLEWALRQTGADAGMIGMTEAEGIRIMAASGYENTYPDWQERPLRKNLLGVSAALASTRIQVLPIADLKEANIILPGTEWQHVVPIMREGEAIGLIVLEKKDSTPPGDENTDFLLRLCDHAAIAISNAQLYLAVNQANIAKSDFVSFVSHELKTPMTSIKGYADLLAAGAVGEINEAQSNFLATIRSNVDRMSTLVSDLADVSRIEAGRLELNFSAVSIPTIIESVINSTQAMFSEKSQELELNLPESLPPVWADQNRIIQIITNLLTNASKYTREEGLIQVTADVAPNTWDEKGAPTVLHLKVIDNGIGIPEEDQHRIFQQYFRTESGKDVAQGTGLGLNITRYLVEMQGGLIWFESVFGEGSTFHVTIPVAETGVGQEG